LREEPLPTNGFDLGDWTVDPTTGSVHRQEETVRLQPKAMEVLIFLADNADRVVSKQEIFETVWTDAHVEEGALAQSIHSVRKALGDDARHPRYIETIPRRGYRLIAPISGPGECEAQQLTPHPRIFKSDQMVTGIFALCIVLAVLAALSRPGKLESPSHPLRDPSQAPLSPPKDSPSLLMLPFKASSGDETSLAQGFWSLIDQRMGSLSGLALKSHTSAKWAAEQEMNMLQIHQKLSVSHVLEGTLVDSGHEPAWELHLSLFRAAEDLSIWKEKYQIQFDRLEASISKIVTEVGEALELAPPLGRSRFSGTPDANQAYLLGLAAMAYKEKQAEEAIEHWKQAITLDPDFASAHAMLAKASAWLYFNGQRGRYKAANQALERARQLAPDLSEVRLAGAYFSSWVESDYERAIEEFEIASLQAPSSFDILQGIGFALRRLRRLEEALERLEDAFDLDSRSAVLAEEIAKTYAALRKYASAEIWFERAWDLESKDTESGHARLLGDRAMNLLALRGCAGERCSTAEARQLLNSAPRRLQGKLAFHHLMLDLYASSEMDRTFRFAVFEEAIEKLDRVGRMTLAERDRQLDHALFVRKAWLLQQIGRGEESRSQLSLFSQQLEDSIRKTGDDLYPKDIAYLGIAYALLGKSEEALARGNQAVRIAAELGLYNSPRQEEHLAIIHLFLGHHDEALHGLEELMNTPYQYAITGAQLRLDPIWDPLRGNPRFERLLHFSG